jgi:hypothetical protein
MKHNSRNFSKTTILAALKAQGLTAERTTENGQRVWKLSDGKTYASLAEMNEDRKLTAPNS